MTTKIAWTDETWNPVRGCWPVSEGCANCYAARMASRFSGPGQPYDGLARGGKWTGRTRFVPEVLDKPLHWRKPRRVFVNSMGDLFDENLSENQIAAVFGVMAACPQHTFQVLTKRPKRMRWWFDWASRIRLSPHIILEHDVPWPLGNVWLGVTAENQAAADERIPLLLDCPAAVRFVSCEPLLGPIDMGPPHMRHLMSSGVDWVIVGAESGPAARPCNLVWVRLMVQQCAAAGVPCFVKQIRYRNHGISKDPTEWPRDLRVQEWPK